MSVRTGLYRTPRDPGGFPFGYDWGATLTGIGLLLFFTAAASAYVTARFAYQPALGEAVVRFHRFAISQPLASCVCGFRNCTPPNPRVRPPLFAGELIVL